MCRGIPVYDFVACGRQSIYSFLQRTRDGRVRLYDAIIPYDAEFELFWQLFLKGGVPRQWEDRKVGFPWVGR